MTMNGNQQTETGCCPRFDPEPWKEKEHAWQDKLFVRDYVRSFMHVPMNFGAVISRTMKKVESSGAKADGYLALSRELSPWKSELLVAVDGEVEGADMVRLSGKFLSKAFEGSYKDMKEWMSEMDSFLASRNAKAEETYFYYTTCPKCAKAYGKNYVVIIARVS